jgi:acyl carrier protein
MDVIMEIEDRFEIDIPINLVSDMTTVADLVALVERQLNPREAV